MTITIFDRLAVQGSSLLHRTAPPSKLISAGLMILGIVLSNRWTMLLALFMGLATSLSRTGLGFRKQVLFYVYPLFFSLLYGFFLAGLTGPDLLAIVLRAVTAVSVLLLLMTTTPYIAVFSVLKRVFPEVLTDILFLTYRAVFLLWSRFFELNTAVKLRGAEATNNVFRKLAVAGTCIGMAFISATDYNERSYRALQLRGYRGDLGDTRRLSPGKENSGRMNGALILFAGLFLVVSVLW